MGAIVKAKPAAKGQYIKSCVVASTMGPGVKVNGAKLVWIDSIRSKYIPSPNGLGIIVSEHFTNPSIFFYNRRRFKKSSPSP